MNDKEQIERHVAISFLNEVYQADCCKEIVLGDPNKQEPDIIFHKLVMEISAVLKASLYYYNMALLAQKEYEFNLVYVNSFKYSGVIPKVIVPDDTKSTVINADCYAPVINTHFGLMCDHYAITVPPVTVFLTLSVL